MCVSFTRVSITLVLVFVIVLGGVCVLYSQFGELFVPDPLSMHRPENGGTTAASTKPKAADPTGAPKTIDETEALLIQAPDFTVHDADENEVCLSDFAGKPIALDFWASWCGLCKMEMPDFHEKYLEIGDLVQFLMINMTDDSRETLNSAAEFIAGEEYTFPVFYDTRSNAAMIYGVYSLPTTFFIDAEGHAIAYANRAIDGATLQRGIDMIMK